MINNLYHCCRLCKWFQDGCCVNDAVFHKDTFDVVYPFYEDGHLSAAIEEGFNINIIPQFEQILMENNVARTKLKSILDAFKEELEIQKVNWIESIDESVSKALNNFDFDIDGVCITDPHTFYCKHYI